MKPEINKRYWINYVDVFTESSICLAVGEKDAIFVLRGRLDTIPFRYIVCEDTQPQMVKVKGWWESIKQVLGIY